MKHAKFMRITPYWISIFLFVGIIFQMSPLSFAEDPMPVPVSEEVVVKEAVLGDSARPEPTTIPGNVSIDFKDADINNVLRILSLKSNVNIVAGPEVTGTITIRLEDVPWEKALDVVLRTYGYVYERDENIVRVTTKDKLSTEELGTETFILNYTTAAEAEVAIKDILTERGRVRSVARTNMLVISDIPTNLHKIRDVVARLDKSTPQAHIDSKIVKTQLQKGENLGIAWNPAGTISGSSRPVTFPFAAMNKTGQRDAVGNIFSRFFPNVSPGSAAVPVEGEPNPFDPRGFPESAPESATGTYAYGTLNFSAFTATLNFLKTRANTKVISNPRITVLNNKEATIKVAKDVPYPKYERNETTGSFEISGYDFKSSGVEMKVTPHINDANEILVDLTPQVTSISNSDVTVFTNSATAALQSLPNINITTATSQVLIKSGETIAIGGLMTDAVSSTEAKVPILGDIPLVGKIFKSKRQTQDTSNEKVETLFFVTVNIVDTEGETAKVAVPIGGGPVTAAPATPGVVVQPQEVIAVA